MNKLAIEMTGPLTSVQDMGRTGAQRYGLAPSGAMDMRALCEANALVDQAMDAAAIEIGPLGFTARLVYGALSCALTGAARPIRINNQPAKMRESILLQTGDVIQMEAARSGVFSYFALQGKLAGEKMFGSMSVNARVGIGAPYPRMLQAGDTLGIHVRQNVLPRRRLISPSPAPGAIRIVPGPQQDRFRDALASFLDADWTLSTACDRMGYRLDGPQIRAQGGHDIVSDGTVNGSIQIPGNGRPIVLMPDRGTTGGYPKIGTVITPDLGALAQMTHGKTFRFAAVDIEEAQRLCRVFYAELDDIPNRLAPAEDEIDEALLISQNIAGNAVSGFDAATWQDEQ